MKDFFYPLLQEINDMIEKNILVATHKNELVKFLPLITSCSCDLPAKADLQGMVGHSGHYECSYCIHPGILVKGEKKSFVRFVIGDNNYKIRTHEDVIESYARSKSTPIFGVKNISCMVAADGVVRQYTPWCSEKNG